MYYFAEWSEDVRVVEVVEEKQALGGDVELGIVGSWSVVEQNDIFEALWREVFNFEKRFSRFLPSSELSYLNERAGLVTNISKPMESILRNAKRLADTTNGLYNPFILPALQRAGYVHSAQDGYEDDAAPDYTKRLVNTTDQLSIDEGTITIPHSSALDLGGCGKGYLADQIGAILRRYGATGYWVSFSGDVATYGTDSEGQPITLAVQPAEVELDYTYTIRCPQTDFGVATSGTFRRPSQATKLRTHHIIDPRSGKSARSNILLATVCAATAIDADVLASCAVVLGSAKARQFLQDKNALAWVLQYRSDTGSVLVETSGDYVIKESFICVG